MTGVEFVFNVEGVPTLYEDLPQAVCAGQYLFVSTMVGVNPDTGRIVMSLDELSDEEPRQLISGRLAVDSWSGPIQAQCWQMFKNIERVLQSQGAQLQDILRINMWVNDFSHLPMLAPVRSLVFAPDDPPPISNIGACDIPVPGAVIQAEVVAALPSRGGKRVSIDSPNVSQFVGHYGLASRSGPVAFAAGMIAASNEQRRVIRSYADLGCRRIACDPLDHVALTNLEDDAQVVGQRVTPEMIASPPALSLEGGVLHFVDLMTVNTIATPADEVTNELGTLNDFGNRRFFTALVGAKCGLHGVSQSGE